MKASWIITVGFFLFASSLFAGACDCPPLSAREGARESDIVFRGELIDHQGQVAVFRLKTAWKGILGPKVEVEWRDGNRGDCNGFGHSLLMIGNDLLVFARRSKDGVYRTSICLPTKLASEAEADIRELGPPRPWGMVQRSNGNNR